MARSGPMDAPSSLNEPVYLTKFRQRFAELARTRVARLLIAVAPSVLGLIAFGLMLATRRKQPLLSVGLWGFVLIISAVGWGAVASQLASRRDRLDWGLKAALGLAVHLCFGGVFMALSITSVTSTVVVTLAGALALGGVRWLNARELDGSTKSRARVKVTSGLAIVTTFYCLAVLHYFGSLASLGANLWDDRMAYFAFPLQILNSGSLIEPFSIRRIACYGGQSYLHALLLSFGSVYRLHGVDNGICFLILGALVIGWARERRSLALVACAPALVVLLALPHTPHNVSSALSGSLFFFALYRVLARPRDPSERRYGRAVLIALLAFAACTLRQNFIIPAVVMPAAFFAYKLIRKRTERANSLHEAGATILASVVFLAPWLIVAYRSGNTIFYPVFHGNGVKDFGLEGSVDFFVELRAFIFDIFQPTALPGWPLAIVAGVVILGVRKSGAFAAILWGAVLGMLATFHGLAALDDTPSVARYVFPIQLAFVLAVTLVAVSSARKPSGMAALALVLGALTLQFSSGRDTLRGIYLGHVNAIENELRLGVPNEDAANALYREIQAAVPAGERLLVMFDEPFRLDFKRNRIVNLDEPGGASPKPGLPIGQGEEKLAKYFVDQGLRYIAFRIDPTSPEYSLQKWQAFLNRPVGGRDGHSRHAQFHAMARYYVDILQNLLKLTESRKHLYQKGTIFVLDLAARAQ